MTRWITPPNADNPRYSNGWWPVLRWPWLLFGNGRVECLNVVSLAQHVVIDPQIRSLRPCMTLDGFAVRIETAAGFRYASYDPVTRTFGPETAELPPLPPLPPLPSVPILPAIDGADAEWSRLLAPGPDGPWVWTECVGGLLEQVFLIGRAIAAPDRLLVVEMPGGDRAAHYDSPTDTWTLVGMDPGGLIQYRDGEMHVVTVTASETVASLRPSVRPFDWPIVIPAGLTCDVWTFGDEIEGRVGGGRSATRPNVQGIGLWPDGRPWLELDKPLLGLWVSPKDSVHGLRNYPDEASLLRLIAAYRVTAITDALLALYRAAKASGSDDFWPIERAIAVEICQTRGCHLTLYHDGTTRDRSEECGQPFGTLYGFGDIEQLKALYLEGIGVVAGINVYPDGTEFWAYESAMDELDALTVVDGPGTARVVSIPYTLTLARYTQRNPNTGHMGYSPIGMATRLYEALRSAVAHPRCLRLDVFGVKRRGEHPEVEPWADRWTHALIAAVPVCDPSRYPVTALPKPRLVGMTPHPALVGDNSVPSRFTLSGTGLSAVVGVLVQSPTDLEHHGFPPDTLAETELTVRLRFTQPGEWTIQVHTATDFSEKLRVQIAPAKIQTPAKTPSKPIGKWKFADLLGALFGIRD